MTFNVIPTVVFDDEEESLMPYLLCPRLTMFVYTHNIIITKLKTNHNTTIIPIINNTISIIFNSRSIKLFMTHLQLKFNICCLESYF